MDLSQAWESIRHLGTSFVAALPRMLLGLVVVVLFFFVGRLLRGIVRRVGARRPGHRNLGTALGRLVHGGTILFGVLVAATIALPSFRPADLIQVLGLGGVAIGFAFKDIFQNYLAGLLLLVTEPFRINDQIVVDGYEGTVEEIQTRATLIRTYDGRRVVIPNGDLYTKSVTVNTAHAKRRSQYDIGIGYGDDIAKAKKIILDALNRAEGVDPDPKADVIVVELGDYSVLLRARWWSDSRIPDVLLAQDKVLQSVKQDLQAAGIDLPYPTRQVLFHDQTEETDGDRRRQREGWPAPRDGEVPRPRSIAGAVALLGERDGAGAAPADRDRARPAGPAA